MTHILVRDLLLNMLLGLVALVVLVLAQVNPASTEQQLTPPGNLIASISWPAGPVDIDIRVGAPGDEVVDYNRKSGKIWSLLRDDLGTANDDTPLNMEAAFTRGLPDGEYAVNVRCYSCAAHVPVPVAVEVRLAEGGLVFSGSVNLLADKQERTAIRFILKDGRAVVGSESSVFKQMKGDK
jgi:hypothetical protein